MGLAPARWALEVGIPVSDFYALPPGPGISGQGAAQHLGQDPGASGRGLHPEPPSMPAARVALGTAREGPGSAVYRLLHLQDPSPSWKLTSRLPMSLSKGEDPVFPNSVYCRGSLLIVRVVLTLPLLAGFLHPRFSRADFYDAFPEYRFHCPGL